MGVLPLQRTLKIAKEKYGNEHIVTAYILNTAANSYKKQKRNDEASLFLLQSISISEHAVGKDAPFTALTYYDYALLNWENGTPSSKSKAYPFFTKAATVFSKRALLSTQENPSIGASLQVSRELDAKRNNYYMHAISAKYASDLDNHKINKFQQEAFEASQWAEQAKAGSALIQSASRFSAGNKQLTKIVRIRQDLTSEWQSNETNLISTISELKSTNNQVKAQNLRARQAAIEQDIFNIDKQLSKEFPEYALLTSPAPLSLQSAQNLLNNDEVLVTYLTGSEGTLVFAVTKHKIGWYLSNVDASMLSESVRGLRQSLEKPSQDFPRYQAYGLYKDLMGELEPLIKNKKHVLIVSSGALGSIPLGVLVTKPPQGNDNDPAALRATSWWGIQQAITTLPSVSSLKALRLFSKNNRAKDPFIGFGNPVLNGRKNDSRSAKLASRGVNAYFRGRHADVNAVRLLSPLPETANELRTLANALHANKGKTLYLGRDATETNVKRTDLSQKRVVAFATHGLLSGDISGLTEPALVLTPPVKATDYDDGLLTASEITQLNLNADWVILSACNTASAAELGADGLSGLSRAFFYAGAKSLLVSHWPVRDDAASRLTTNAIRAQEANPRIGKAEALRISMVKLMNDNTDDSLAHPSAWAPFVIVGEGG